MHSGDAIEFDIKSTGCKNDENNHVRFLEHVQLYSTIDYTRRGDLHINVTSPQGTNTVLLSERAGDHSSDGFKNWAFMSVHSWGEDPNGVWKVRIHDRVSRLLFKIVFQPSNGV